MPITAPAEQTHDTIFVSQTYRDTIYHQDSVCLVMELRNDTVYRDRIQYKYIYKEHMRIDTTYISKCDTVISTIKTNELTKWQKKQIRAGNVMMVLIVLGLIYIAYKTVMIWRK